MEQINHDEPAMTDTQRQLMARLQAALTLDDYRSIAETMGLDWQDIRAEVIADSSISQIEEGDDTSDEDYGNSTAQDDWTSNEDTEVIGWYGDLTSVEYRAELYEALFEEGSQVLRDKTRQMLTYIIADMD